MSAIQSRSAPARHPLGDRIPQLTISQMREALADVIFRHKLDGADEDRLIAVDWFLERQEPLAKPIAELMSGKGRRS